MSRPLVSVIIPTYGGANFLGNAIRSVLDQTYSNFELIIIDDKSPDNTEDVVRQFSDPRIKYIRHEINQGAATARGTGRRASSGEIIAFLDQDDLFHPEKLEAHVEFLNQHPDVGFTYNPYFELIHSSDRVRTVFMPPQNISLAELTVGFYLPPSAWVVRREWAFHEEIWDAHATLRGREIVVCGRLFMAGCKFARVDRVLHYRGYHARRKVSELEKNCNDELACQEIVLSDPRCPTDVLTLRSLANTVINLMWANVAFTQKETGLGRQFLWNVAQANPSAFWGTPSLFINFLMGYCVDDESHDYEELLDLIFSQLPSDIPNILPNYFWMVSRGNFIRGVRALIWDRPGDAEKYLSQAIKYKFDVDDAFVQQVTHELLGYEMAYGINATFDMFSKLSSGLLKFTDRRTVNWFKGSYFISQANRNYLNGQLGTAFRNILGAMISYPRYLLNRGVMLMLIKSMLGIKSGRDK
ncbi:MAG: glycosyltransferase family 2 protein [Anaerolineales bacterium]|nr:glycosyltransferase family 2 protein [Anaerolineales bacterium]